MKPTNRAVITIGVLVALAACLVLAVSEIRSAREAIRKSGAANLQTITVVVAQEMPKPYITDYTFQKGGAKFHLVFADSLDSFTATMTINKARLQGQPVLLHGYYGWRDFERYFFSTRVEPVD